MVTTVPKYTERYVETCIIGMLVRAHANKLGEIETAEYIMRELKSYGVMSLAEEPSDLRALDE